MVGRREPSLAWWRVLPIQDQTTAVVDRETEVVELVGSQRNSVRPRQR